MAKFKETKSYTFDELRRNYLQFEIPNFQRPYAWKNKQLQDFFNSVVENDKEYFIGNIVAVEGNPIKIIDGQQRLTTIFILLIVMRDLYKNISSSDEREKKEISDKIKAINYRLLFEDEDDNPGEFKKRLVLGKKSYQEVFEWIVDRGIEGIDVKNLGDNERRFVSNYKILEKLTKNYISNSELQKLGILFKKVVTLQIILILCSTDNDVYSIFEGFNSTGLGLSVADLIKNAVLRQTASDENIQKEVETSWLEIESIFENTAISKFPKFLRHQWISTNGYILMSNLFVEIRDKKIKNKSPQQVLEYVNTLVDDAKIYAGLMYQRYETQSLGNTDKDLMELLVKFRFLRNDQVYELLLAYYKTFRDGKLRKSTFKKYLERIWVFIFRTRFISINPSEYEKIFARHCKEVADATDANEISKYFDIFINKLKRLVSDDEQFIENFVSDIKYGSDNKLIKEVFLSIMSNDNPSIQLRNPEIEHILPQNPKKWGLEKSEIREYVNKIGNLTLLFEKDNKNVSDETIDAKCQKAYSVSHFMLNKDIADKWQIAFKTDWRTAIEDRGIYIAKKIADIFKL